MRAGQKMSNIRQQRMEPEQGNGKGKIAVPHGSPGNNLRDS